MKSFLYTKLLFRLFDLEIIGQCCVFRKSVMISVVIITYMLTSANYLSFLLFIHIELN